MKNLLFFALLGALLFSSCGGDDDDLVGNWVGVSADFVDCDDPNENSSVTLSTEECTAADDGCFYVEFIFTETIVTANSQISFFGVFETDSESGSYTRNGDEIEVCFDGDCQSSQFSIDGDILTIITDEDLDGCMSTNVFRRK
jgi:hypothetical protein